MKLDQLRAFIAVVETGSFRAAAEAIHKTQPSISAAVKALEEQYGIVLLDRESYRPTLTAEGKAFFKQSKKLLLQVNQLEHLGHHLAQGTEQQPLRLCISQMSLTEHIVGLLKAFDAEHPHIAVELTTDHLNGVQEHLIKEKSDVAIGPSYGLDDRHIFVEVGKLEMTCVVHPDLLPTLQAGSQKVKQQALYSLPQILVSRSAEEQEHRFVLPTGRRWHVNDFQAKKTLVQAGMGWARMPHYMIKDSLEEGRLVRMDVENFSSHSQFPLFMIRLRNQTLSPEANAFWRFIKSYLKTPISDNED
ncbi:LysR family transcriptional regulator [Marinomonas fungiae]|uniref:DNA-binding transcriptional regulator, LysR family n=1 Tax=Marinomonas fungiae TaxID=1137284 RepID=A0A0K6IMY1_9GAMM|nr:LysR family transcriptional regulator [Marinomonas fungiae]CUB04459.1 DNA-binding transcriptional regulator, LysR family [Marinomonas fungiae]